MPRCEGLPGIGSAGNCPNNCNDNSVTLSQGDMMLCPSCAEARFPTDNKNKQIAMAGTNEPHIITQLSELSSVDCSKYSSVFLDSLHIVYRYAAMEELIKTDMECLASLQKQLGDLVLHTFSEYKDKRVINRQVKNKIARDIFYMGYSIANKQAAKELEKILVPKTQPNSDTTHDVLVPPGDELQTLIQVVADLTTRLDCLENRLKVVESEKSELKQQLESHSQKQTTVTPVTQNQNPKNNKETDESSTS